MRPVYLLLTFACLPLFAQEVAPVPSGQARQGAQRRLFSRTTMHPHDIKPGHFFANVIAGGTCSIPLLNAMPPGKPVKMPKITPPKGQVDKFMPNSVPAPACPSDMARAGAPAPELPPPATPPVGARDPRKP